MCVRLVSIVRKTKFLAACATYWRHRYYDLKPADLGELVKLPRMGKTLHRFVHQFPRVELAASVQPITRALLRVELTITPDFLFDEKASDVKGNVAIFCYFPVAFSVCLALLLLFSMILFRSFCRYTCFLRPVLCVDAVCSFI